MKQLLYPFVFCCLTLLAVTSCEQDSEWGNGIPEVVGNSIVLDFDSSSLPVSRATTEATGTEVAVEHLDVIIFASDDDTKVAHYERVSNLPEKHGKAVLAAKRSSFGANKNYHVYVIANSTASVETFQAEDFDLNKLKGLIQTDRAIHLTGLQSTTEATIPTSFLMDGMAYSGDTESNTAVVLYNGNKSENTELKVTLRRAAAKIVVNITKGEKVTFGNDPAALAGYYLRNMPYTTSVISGVNAEAERRTPEPSSSKYFNWTENKVTVTAYAYAADWSTGSNILEKEVRLIVNIPLTYQETDGSEKFYESSYYQIPVSESKKLLRNTCYEVNVTLNAPGGSNPSKPLVLEPISYSVAPWTEKTITVGGESDRPAYLALNEYDMEMHNMADDSTTLEFASSSEVTVTIDEVWYIDKFGLKKNLTVRNGDEWGENTGTDNRPNWKNLCRIRITPDENINGKIHVYGTVPENNTIRYIKFNVTNKDNITKTVTVEQYPLEYITNIRSWYSYRDDFKNSDPYPTTYEYKGDRIYGVSYSNNSYEYESSYYQSLFLGGYETNTSSGFWRSKVANSQNNDGSSNIKYYYYNSKGEKRESDAETGNARMYHVRITASSGDYTLGNPRITDDGYTDPGADNAQLVSPSFMIASRLGFVNTNDRSVDWTASYALDVARKHCNEYVEVYKDDNGQKVVLDDWRLPTTAELQIIMKFQGTSSEDADAIDYLLNADYYWSASERVYNQKHSSGGTSIRCIRDAYNKKTGK